MSGEDDDDGSGDALLLSGAALSGDSTKAAPIFGVAKEDEFDGDLAANKAAALAVPQAFRRPTFVSGLNVHSSLSRSMRAARAASRRASVC